MGLDVNKVIDGIAGRTVPTPVTGASVVMMLLGVLGLGYGFGVSGSTWTFGAILVAIVYWIAIAQGGVLFAVMLTGTWGRWGRPIKRIAETFGFFLPIAYLALVVFTVAGMGIYPWIQDPSMLEPHSAAATVSKPLWLTHGMVMIRQVGAFAILLALDFMYIRASLRPDMIQASARLGDKAPGWWKRFTGGAKSLEAEVEVSTNFQSTIFPWVTLAYVLTFTLMVMDLLMSLKPWWYANMFPGWVWVSSFWLSLAALGLTSMLARDWLGLKDVIKPHVTHDLGKLMLAGCMFWAYTAYAQILPIWYTGIPEETEVPLVRIMLPEWSWLAWTVAVLCFVAPFTILLSRGIKKMRWPFAGICTLIMIGLFFERSMIVLPAIHFERSFPVVDFILVNVTIWLGMGGLFTFVTSRVLASIPPLVTSDPYLKTHPWDVHVHSLDAHHH